MKDAKLIWNDPNWRADCERWIASQLRTLNVDLAGKIEPQKVQPWAAVLRVPTNGGLLYFKANMSGFRHETTLCAALNRWRPDCVLPLLAVDEDQGWMLMQDGGRPLRELIQSTGDLSQLQHALRLYAEFQIALSAHLPELLEIGVDRRLRLLPSEYARLVEDKETMMVCDANGVSASEHEQLLRLAPRVTELCEQLATFQIPETLQHDDFHDNNVLVKDDHYWLADWADSCISHPFCSLTVALRSPAHHYELEDNGPELKALRDAYLEPWTQVHSHERLLDAVDIANKLGMISRALTWHRVVDCLEGEVRLQYAESVPGWLLEFLEADSGV